MRVIACAQAGHCRPESAAGADADRVTRVLLPADAVRRTGTFAGLDTTLGTRIWQNGQCSGPDSKLLRHNEHASVATRSRYHFNRVRVCLHLTSAGSFPRRCCFVLSRGVAVSHRAIDSSMVRRCAADRRTRVARAARDVSAEMLCQSFSSGSPGASSAATQYSPGGRLC